MKFEIYCDESRQDLFTTGSDCHDRFMLIGGLWLPRELRDTIKNDIKALKHAYSIGGEIKWKKVSPVKYEFYKALIDLFFTYKLDLRFRCIAVETGKMNFSLFHENDRELGFYKFYYQLLHHWIDDFNEYSIFTDLKTNRSPNRLKTLRNVLRNANLTTEINSIQALPSQESVFIQFADFLLGLAGSRLNNSVTENSAKGLLIGNVEEKLHKKLAHTQKYEKKFNIFVINLKGGW